MYYIEFLNPTSTKEGRYYLAFFYLSNHTLAFKSSSGVYVKYIYSNIKSVVIIPKKTITQNVSIKGIFAKFEGSVSEAIILKVICSSVKNITNTKRYITLKHLLQNN
jgi:hypothetical protein